MSKLAEMSRRSVAALLAALAAVAAGPAVADHGGLHVFTVTGFGVGVEAGPGATPTTKNELLFAELTVGNSFAQADLLAGTFKASTFVFGTDAQLARASGFIGLRHDGPGPVTIPAGFISAHLTAAFAHTIGIPPEGMSGGFGNQLVSSLFVGPTPITSAGVVFSHGGDGTPATESFILEPTDVTSGGMTIFHAGSRSMLDVTFEMGAFTLADGQIFDLQAFLSAVAIATSHPLGPFYGASVDAGHTLQLAMVLPAGVTLDSPVALAWVTAVPEPETYALLLGGLSLVAWVAKRRRKSA